LTYIRCGDDWKAKQFRNLWKPNVETEHRLMSHMSERGRLKCNYSMLSRKNNKNIIIKYTTVFAFEHKNARSAMIYCHIQTYDIITF